MLRNINIKNPFRRKGSKEIAKDRLKILLISDRVNCSAETLEMIKNDIIKVISKYMEIDIHKISLDILSDSKENELNSRMFLIARIPFREINKVIY